MIFWILSIVIHVELPSHQQFISAASFHDALKKTRVIDDKIRVFRPKHAFWSKIATEFGGGILLDGRVSHVRIGRA